MSADSRNNIVKKSIVEQMTAFLSLIFAVILITVIAIPQVLQALFRLIYYNRRNRKDIRGKLAILAGSGVDNELMKFISIKLLRLGCNLVIIGDNMDGNFIKELDDQYEKIKRFTVDVTNISEVTRMFQIVINEYGSIDMLINIPKLLDPDKIMTHSAREITEELKSAFAMTMFLTLSIIDVMKSQNDQGHIITISPTAGLSMLPDKYPQFSVFYSFMKSINGSIKSDGLGGKIKTTFVLPSCLKNGMLLSGFISNRISFLPLSSDIVADDVIEAILENKKIMECPSNLTNLSRFIKFLNHNTVM